MYKGKIEVDVNTLTDGYLILLTNKGDDLYSSEINVDLREIKKNAFKKQKLTNRLPFLVDMGIDKLSFILMYPMVNNAASFEAIANDQLNIDKTKPIYVNKHYVPDDKIVEWLDPISNDVYLVY